MGKGSLFEISEVFIIREDLMVFCGGKYAYC